ncbi:hypothetical protein M3Y99_01205300 [Aphelenchoides fujianensis]|nr:hypothetical protein M3Y99_01205300 [Aphelenchoides fujianensis]
MSGFLERQAAKAAEKRMKSAVDRHLGGNEGDEDEDDERSGRDHEEDGEGGGRGRRLFRKFSDRFRRRGRSASSSGSSKSPGDRIRSLLGRKKDETAPSATEGASATPATSDPEVVDTETPVQTSDGASSDDQNGAQTESSGGSRAGSDWQSGATSDEEEAPGGRKRAAGKSDELRLLEMRPDDSVAYNPRAKMPFTVRVRVIEAKELHGENVHPLVRVHLGGKTRTTRSIRGTDQPRWDQTLSFTLRSSLEDLAHLNCEFNTYSARRLIRDSLIGTFSINMGVVYKSKGQAVVEKWLALMPGPEDEEGGGGSSGAEIRGFLKASICVFHSNQIPPSLVTRGGGADDDVLYRAQLLNYVLRFRVFRLSQLADHIRRPFPKQPAASGHVAVEVAVGPYSVMSSFLSAEEENVYIGEELQVPIMWPTVIKQASPLLTLFTHFLPLQIRFRLIALTKKQKKRVVCTEFISLRQLCQSGARGYLPSFGPSLISFYGPEQTNGGVFKRWKEKHVRNGNEAGSFFCGGLFFELLCEESTVQKTHVVEIPTATARLADTLYQQQHYTFFCTFFAANLIHHTFKSKDVTFEVSMGENGSRDYNRALECTNRTLPVMPAYDTTAAYAMPWGNQKPICEILGDWEEIGWRFEATNIADLLTRCQTEAAMKSGSNPEACEVASVVVEALEEAALCFETFRRFVRHNAHSPTALDVLLRDARLDTLDRLYDAFAEFKFELHHLDDMNESAIRQLGVFAQQLREAAADPQLSLPDVVIHMRAGGQLVGFARLSPADFFFGHTALRSGQWCGQLRAGHELPCVLHIRGWFGRSRDRADWLQRIQPAALKYYAELFYNEKRSALSSNWKPTGKQPPTVSDEPGALELSESAFTPPPGWRFGGEWTPKRSHDMWDPVTGGWSTEKYTTFYGDEVDRASLNRAPTGWTYESKWAVDLHCPGDADGWQYSVNGVFWTDAGEVPETIDTTERQTHRFRRRRHKRRRRFAANNAGVAEMFEDVAVFAKHLDGAGWEFAQKFGEPVHIVQQSGDRFRRRRMVRELVPEGDSSSYKLGMRVASSGAEAEPNFLSPRIYEVHDVVSTYQLRVYVLWGRELHTSKKHISRAFVRVFFLNRCQETCVIENSMNPIWNETLLFDRLPVPGAVLQLRAHPPALVVECHGEELNGKPVFLGRFDVQPTVINSPVDSHSQPAWHPLRFNSGKTKGALLLHSEFFQADPTLKKSLPRVPNAKPKLAGRFEVPVDRRPQFAEFTVQLMAWGVRNLARHQMLSVRSPFIEITVADRRDTTDTIDDTGVNPNFERPLLTFSAVQMPSLLNYAPPIVLNLHDRRSFGRKPLVGTCIVKNFQRFMCAPPAAVDSKEIAAEWDAFDAEMIYESQMQQKELAEMRKHEPEEYAADPKDPNSPRIDWWSKYFHSKGKKEKAPGYEELGLDRLQLFKGPLEHVGEYNGFADFLDTFTFLKPAANALDGDPNAEKRGELKGKLFITRVNEQNKAIPLQPSGVEFDKPVECVVRVYVVRAFDLVGRRRSGQCDPYLTIRCGNKKKFKGHKEYVPDSKEPMFGQCIEMDVTIPQEKDLTVSVMDRRLVIADDEIGSTVIDLENRLLTKHRATVGLPRQYNVIGPLPWRDQLNPLQTLRRFCSKMKFPPPRIVRNAQTGDVGIELVGVPFWLSEAEAKSTYNKHFVGRPLQRLALHCLRQVGLVPEHVETRALYNSVNPEAECGVLEMWVDVFPKCIAERIPPAIDITPRQPQPYQLRIAVFGLRNVILQKKSMGRPAADLYVRVYLNGMQKAERTDIHYRCLEGAASFNWRFVFDVDYDVFERKIRAARKKRLFRKRATELVDPVLVVEIWDNNKFGRDQYIGQCTMNLLGFEEGQVDEEEMENVHYDKEPPLRTCCAVCLRTAGLCWRTRCCMKRQRKKDLVQMPRAPRYVPGRVGSASLFQQRTASGWWPCTATVLPAKQKADRKKNDQPETDDQQAGEGVEYVTGMVEMELHLVPMAEALAEPVGKKRKKPNHSPHLPKPDRPKMDSFWCTSRLKAGARICWNKTGGWSCVWLVLFGGILLLLTIALIYQLPSILLNRLIPFGK